VIPVEVTQTPWHFTTFWDWLDHWQTGLAGAGALLAAVIAVGGSEWRARKALRASLASEIRLYVDLLIKTRETLMRREEKFLSGKQPQRDFRDLAVLHPPTVYPAAAAGTMGLLRRPRAAAVVAFYASVERVNFSARAMSNEPDAKVSVWNYSALTDQIEEACRASLPLLFEFPFDKRDAYLKAKIAKWDAHYAEFGVKIAKWDADRAGHP
jgi:hypothetical protein